MHYTSDYRPPLGEILLAADYNGLTGLWFYEQKHFARELGDDGEERETDIIFAARKWLDDYFVGKEPSNEVPIHFEGTDFQREVWGLLRDIPYGQTTTYGDLANKLAKSRELDRMSAQAVGGAVGHNKISIIVPCHSVVGANGSLSGYADGISRKAELLNVEGAWQKGFFAPKKSTAP